MRRGLRDVTGIDGFTKGDSAQLAETSDFYIDQTGEQLRVRIPHSFRAAKALPLTHRDDGNGPWNLAEGTSHDASIAPSRLDRLPRPESSPTSHSQPTSKGPTTRSVTTMYRSYDPDLGSGDQGPTNRSGPDMGPDDQRTPLTNLSMMLTESRAP
ncbi:hypothetical protein U1Q18_027437 [Sarracenia purpurea var. burkii]